MDETLKEQLVHAMLRFKKVGMTFPPGLDIRMGELFVMSGIAKRTSCPDKNVNVSDIQSNLYITKPAVSQMLNALEKKGYVIREIDKSDRRKIAVTLTDHGQDILKQTKEYTDQMLETVISRFGEENTWQLIKLFSLLSDITEDLKREASEADKKGDDQLD
ncbi:MAG: MarR family winged helix-turn-helix transcriptional regulator [Acetanaerobacterium sp.]